MQQQMEPEFGDLEQLQRNISQQYNLQLGDWLLLPDINATTHLYPAVELAQIIPGEDVQAFAWRYSLSLSQLKNVNQPIKTPDQLEDLRGQWVVVPRIKTDSTLAQASSPQAEKIQQWMDGFWHGANQQGASRAAVNQASSIINQAATAEVESWLNHTGGHARVKMDTRLKGDNDFGLDYLLPLRSWQDDILFTQFSAHRWNERNIVNLGFGWRHMINPDLMFGSNLFYDQDLTRDHNRFGTGLELWSQRLRASANYYSPLSDWRHSADHHFLSDGDYFTLYERAARGWDVKLDAALGDHFAANAGWFQWYGDKVDVKGSRNEVSADPHGLTVGLKWQPLPLLSLQTQQDFISNQSNEFKAGLNLSWQFGRTLDEMLDPDRAQALPSLMQSSTAFVERNNNIVLAYKEQKKSWQIYFDPTEMSIKAGSQPFIHAVKGTTTAHTRYRSSDTSVALVDSISGQVTPLRAGKTTVTAEAYVKLSDQPVSRASYQLTVLPNDAMKSLTLQVLENGVINADGDIKFPPGKTGRILFTATAVDALGNPISGREVWWRHLNPQLGTLQTHQGQTDASGKAMVYLENINTTGSDTVVASLLDPGAGKRTTDTTGKEKSVAFNVVPPHVSLALHTAIPTPQVVVGSGKVAFIATLSEQDKLGISQQTLNWSSDDQPAGTTMTDQDGISPTELTAPGSYGSGYWQVAVKQPGGSAQQLSLPLVRQATEALRADAVTVEYGATPQTLQVNGGNGGTKHFSSADEEVVTIDASSGLMRFHNVGQAMITVRQDMTETQQEPAPITVVATVTRAQGTPLTAQDLSMKVGETSTITVSGGNSNGTALSWSSSAPGTVSVDANGKLTAVAAGTAKVTISEAESSNYLAQQTTITVTVGLNIATPLTGPSAVEASFGDNPRTLTISGGNGSALNAISTDETVAKVSSASGNNFTVTFIKAGTANITISQAATSSHTAPASLTIPLTVKRISGTPLTAQNVSMKVGATGAITVSGGNSNGTALSWGSSAPGTVSVDANGKLTAVAAGIATVTISEAESTNYLAQQTTITVTVELNVATPLTGPSAVEASFGDNPRTLTISGGNGSTLNYASNDETVAKVTNATVTFLKAGTTNITVSQAATSSHTAPANLTIPVTVKRISGTPLSAQNVSMKVGETSTITVSGGNSNGTALSWSSSAPGTARVDANGKLTAVAAGMATVTISEAESTNYLAQQTTITVTVALNVAPPLSAGDVTVTQGDAPQVLNVSGGNNGGTKHFSSSDASVVTVDASSGLMTFINAGTATITVRQDATLTEEAPAPINVPVTVNAAAPLPLVISSSFVSSTTVPVTATWQFTVTQGGQAVSGVCVKAVQRFGGTLMATTTSSNGWKNFTFNSTGVDPQYGVLIQLC
ncbi:inverse autotransporter beta domain-containing protein [Erwiniaceae bacterium BAC15a-03b]|uniref:Inverse autotransporter beta domain-containing protein n=1 Tax=Winslowiella arboricola TaxID=2978220 RepID=A0A9J6PPY2_9GAMM|nr:inverse autotransporter beta domain-containing protein [Winslowiella arboricola]MCU5773666.1 inverse autotransporter beta domain-containing protein [Winslowiella arboricola]MCU5778435.1 inverse autotransporter beta domain-containing protein [Winslowiella arboricola]